MPKKDPVATEAAERLRSTAGEARHALAELRSGIDGYRARIADLKEEREAVSRAPTTLEEAMARLDARLGSAAISYDLDRPLSVLTDPREPLRDPRETRLLDLVVGHAMSDRDINEVLAALFGAELRRFFEGALNRHLADLAKEGITPLSQEERTERLATIDAELLAVESDEEALIVAAENVGFAIERRADVDPRVLLEVVQ